MKVMISHAHEEQLLATAWKILLETVTNGQIEVWYSSDTRPEGGMQTGEWWNTLFQNIQDSQIVLATITYSSASRSWIQWECGVARAQESTEAVIPVLYDLSPEKIQGPLSGFHVYRGDQRGRVEELLGTIALIAKIDIDVESDFVQLNIDQYLNMVSDFSSQSLLNKLLSDDFHVPDNSLEGTWYIDWYREDGSRYPVYECELKMSKDRFYIISESRKPGYDNVPLNYFPMEGIISNTRSVVIMYWDPRGTGLCGTLVMQIAGSGVKMIGKWMGATSDDPDAINLTIKQGKVIMTRGKPDYYQD